MRTLLVTLGLILCTIVVFAGEQRKPKTHTVTIEGMRFQPEALTVARGDTIVWVNKDIVPTRRRQRPATSIRKTFKSTSPGNTPSRRRGTSPTSARFTRR